MSRKICLDAGHTGKYYNQSTVVPEYYESEMVWKLHLYLKEELEARGFEVVTTRANQDDTLAVYDRGCCAKGCDVFLSLHSNACGTESVDYPVVYRAYDNLNSADGVGLALATKIASTIGTSQSGRTATRTTTSGTEYYGVMRGARAVGCPLYLLLEHSFHTNQKATLWLMEDANLKVLAEMEADFFADYFGMDKKEDTSGYTKIMGGSQVTVGQMKAYLQSVQPEAKEYLVLADYFQQEGQAEGVRGDIAFAQACLETGNFQFGGDVLPEQNNFCGLGATGNGVASCAFETKELGARAQIQHLKAYASTDDLYQVCVDPRFGYVTRASAEYVEWLGIPENPNGNGWAAAANYGTQILAILTSMKGMEEMEETIPEWMAPSVEWMVENQLMMGDGDGNLRVNDTLTRGEFAVMLKSYHENCNKLS